MGGKWLTDGFFKNYHDRIFGIRHRWKRQHILVHYYAVYKPKSANLVILSGHIFYKTFACIKG